MTLVADLVALGRFVWPYCAGAAALGLCLGLAAWTIRPPGLAGRGLALLAALAVAAGLVAAGGQLVPGRFGLALDIGVMLAVSCVAGCLVGYEVRRIGGAGRSADWS